MAGYQVVAPTEERRALFRSSVELRPLDEVVDAVADAVTSVDRSIYIERRGTLVRWSFATRGGPYPLLRLVCGFLDIPHHWVLVSSATIAEWCVTANREGGEPDAWAVLDVQAETPAQLVRTMILEEPALLHN